MTEQIRHSPEVLESKLRRYRVLTILLAAVSAFLLVVVIGQSAMNSGGPSPEAAAAADPEPAPTDSPIVHRDPENARAIGAVDAPVVLVEWVDMRCPFCAVFHRDTLPTLIDEYVDQGLVRIEMHDVAYFGEESAHAAVAARAAGEQGRFFDYVNAVYASAPDDSHAELPRERLIALAEEAGVPDIPTFAAALDDPAHYAAVSESTQTAQMIGVNAVPFFVIGTTALSGAQPVEVFRQFIDDALAEAR